MNGGTLTRRPKAMLLFNPRVTQTCRVPNSILQIAAVLEGRIETEFVDGNRERDPWPEIEALLASGRFGYFGVTVMPGPQLRQAVPITRRVRERFPDVAILWGGYFPSNQPEVVVKSGLVDFVLRGPADDSLPMLFDAIEADTPPDSVPGLAFLRDGSVIRTRAGPVPDPDAMPHLPLERLARRYPMAGYLPRTFLGRRTHAMHTSMGCPFRCSFCAVVPIFDGRWKGRSADMVADDVLAARDAYGVDAIEFTDNNFFVSEARTRQFAQRMVGQGVSWWGEGRIDTMDLYADETLRLMREAGCRMIFFGAETGDDAQLAKVNKGGKQSGAQILRFAERLRRFDIIPEYSFVLGFPQPSEAEMWSQIHRDIDFIREVKRCNPATETILYIYSPVPTEGNELHDQISQAGFRFPETLDEWLTPVWESFDLHRNPLTPWLTPAMVRHIQDFEVVLNARHPTHTSFHITGFRLKLMQALAKPRYAKRVYRWPIEQRILQRLYRYVRPETEGFYAE